MYTYIYIYIYTPPSYTPNNPTAFEILNSMKPYRTVHRRVSRVYR